MAFAVNQIWRCVAVLTAKRGLTPQATLKRLGNEPGTLLYTGTWAEEFELGRNYRLIALPKEGGEDANGNAG